MEIVSSLGAWLSQHLVPITMGFTNASLIAWVVLRQPNVQKWVQASIGGKVARMELIQQQRAQKAAQVGLMVIETARLSLPELFDNPLFVWDNIGVLLLEAIKNAHVELEPEELDIPHQLLRDEVFRLLLQQDLEAVKGQLVGEYPPPGPKSPPQE